MKTVRLNTLANPVFVDIPTDISDLTGSVTTTLKQAYANGASNADETMSVTAALGAVTILDAAAALAGGAFLVLDNTKAFTVFGAGQSIGLLSSGSFNFASTPGNWFTLINTSPATIGVPEQISPDIVQQGTSWNGALARSFHWNLYARSVTNGVAAFTADYDFVPTRQGSGTSASPTMRLTWDGTTHFWQIPPAGTIQNVSQGATNTTAIQVNPNVADGATSIAVDINNGTTLSTAGALLLRLRNNGTVLGSAGLTNFFYGHFISNVTTTSAAPNANAGTGASFTLSANSTDEAGIVTLVSGNANWATGVQGTVTFGKTFPNGCSVEIFPADQATASGFNQFTNNRGWFATGHTNGFDLGVSNAFAGAITFVFNYRVTGF